MPLRERESLTYYRSRANNLTKFCKSYKLLKTKKTAEAVFFNAESKGRLHILFAGIQFFEINRRGNAVSFFEKSQKSADVGKTRLFCNFCD